MSVAYSSHQRLQSGRLKKCISYILVYFKEYISPARCLAGERSTQGGKGTLEGLKLKPRGRNGGRVFGGYRGNTSQAEKN